LSLRRPRRPWQAPSRLWPGGGWTATGPVELLVVLCTLPELVLTGADLGLWGSPVWRGLAYQWGAFWPGLLGNWRPNYTLQPWTMFLSYAFLHAGLWHLGLNMLTLVSLGRPLVARLGRGRFWLLWLAATLGGGLGYAALSHLPQPMIGASGALFGLAGALVWLQVADLARAGAPAALVARALLQPLLLLTLLNVLMYWAMGGRLAWQTHLGGFLAGALIMLPLGTRRRR
jgi:membrane associated rhomboid family serine protease